MVIIAIEVIIMNNKNNGSAVKLITNKLFIFLIAFAIGIISVSVLWGSKSRETANDKTKKTDTSLPVISESEDKTKPEQNESESNVIKKEKIEIEESSDEKTEVNFKIPLKGELLKPYSEEELLWDETMCDWRTHCGIDILSNLGDEVDTAGAGIVTDAYYDEMYGTVVKIDHQNGVETVYKNLEKAVVSKGDKVDDGQMIGTVGDGGAFEISEKPHLHLEVICDDKLEDPLKIIPRE